MSTTNFHSVTHRIRSLALKGIASSLKTSIFQSASSCIEGRPGIQVALFTSAVGATVMLYRSATRAKDAHTIHKLLNSGHEGLALECVDAGRFRTAPAGSSKVAEVHATGTVMFGDIPVTLACDAATPPTPVTVDNVPSFVEMNNTPSLCNHHRVVRKGQSHDYMNAVIAECKVKFGVPSNTIANRKAIERYASTLMKGHGVRPTHIRKYLPMVTKMVFIPDQWQVEAERLSGTAAAWESVWTYLWHNAKSVVPRDDHC